MTRESIDRAIFEKLRLAVVAAGYLPDVTDYDNIEDFETAKDELRATISDGQLIDVIGVGGAFERGEKLSCVITIDRRREIDGKVACVGAKDFESFDSLGKTKYRKMEYPPVSKSVDFEIRLIATSIKKERIIKTIIDTALGSLKTVKGIDDDGLEIDDSFVIKRVSVINLSGIDDVVEWLYNYNIADVWLEEKTVVADNLAAIETVDMELDINGDSEVTSLL